MRQARCTIDCTWLSLFEEYSRGLPEHFVHKTDGRTGSLALVASNILHRERNGLTGTMLRALFCAVNNPLAPTSRTDCIIGVDSIGKSKRGKAQGPFSTNLSSFHPSRWRKFTLSLPQVRRFTFFLSFHSFSR